MLQDVQNAEGSHALGVGRQVAGLEAAVVHAQGLHEVRPVALEVGKRQQAAPGLHGGGDARGNAALVEFMGPVAHDAFQGGGQIRLAQHIPFAGQAAVRQEASGKARILLQAGA